MSSMKPVPLSLFAAVLAMVAVGLVGADDQKKDEPPKKNLMTLKLEHAQKVLAAVAQNDFSTVEKNGQELIRISNELAWKQIRTDRYEELGKEYRNEVQGLIRAAKNKNSEAMALAYVKTTLACFNCHNHVREVRIAGQ
ncbi:MAG TPA: hypothetical protein PLN21_03275 [Gemmatales bacterium]|nr:hypothetical protein [Gemmatales bacterium]